jgi:hypothetical protein
MSACIAVITCGLLWLGYETDWMRLQLVGIPVSARASCSAIEIALVTAWYIWVVLVSFLGNKYLSHPNAILIQAVPKEPALWTSAIALTVLSIIGTRKLFQLATID